MFTVSTCSTQETTSLSVVCSSVTLRRQDKGLFRTCNNPSVHGVLLNRTCVVKAELKFCHDIVKCGRVCISLHLSSPLNRRTQCADCLHVTLCITTQGAATCSSHKVQKGAGAKWIESMRSALPVTIITVINPTTVTVVIRDQRQPVHKRSSLC